MLATGITRLIGLPTTRRVLSRFYQTEVVGPSEVLERSPYEELKVVINFKSSEKNPIKVNAYGQERDIVCVCDDVHFVTLKKGPPVKTKCGYWFQLVDQEKFWLKPGGKES